MRAIDANLVIPKATYMYGFGNNKYVPLKSIEQAPILDVVPRSVYDQIKWERDIAMQQLEENGIAFGAKPKVGKWIYDHWCEFKCSECGCFSKSEPRGREKYCPNCGCKMENGDW